MFRPARKKAALKAKDKATFKLEFHLTQVPQQRWDKLIVSVVSLDTGKVVSKTSKSPVKNGTCHWAEALSESISIPQELNRKDAAKESHKLVVSTGLSRFGIVGDATVSLVDYLQSTTPVSLSLPLQNCNVGSILHVKVQRVLSKSASRDDCEQKESLDQSYSVVISEREPVAADLVSSADDAARGENVYSQADVDDSVDVPPTPLMEEASMHTRDFDEFMSMSSSASSSGRLEALGGGCDGEVVSPETLFDPLSASASSQDSPAHHISSSNLRRLAIGEEIASVSTPPKVAYEEKNTWETSQCQTYVQRTVPFATPNMWENDGNQVTVAEIEALRQQLASEAKRSEEVHKTLSILIEERDSIKQEMESLKLMEVSHQNSQDGRLKRTDEEACRQIMKELQDELDYVKGININLSVQLGKMQESNSELLLEIQDLEKELERHRAEGENKGSMVEDNDADLKQLVESLRKELTELERDSQELTEENLDLLSQLKKANDKLNSNGNLGAKMGAFNSFNDVTIRNDTSECGLKEKLEESEESRGQLEEQSQSFLDRVTKTENEHLNPIGVTKNLEAACQMLQQDKDETVEALKNQLQETNERLSAFSRLYDEQGKVMEGMKAEKAKLEVELATVLRSEEEERQYLCQLQAINTELQERLHQEQLNASKFLQQCRSAEANSLLSQKELFALQQMMTELETSWRDLTTELHSLQEKEMSGLSQIKQLELQMALLEGETDSLRASNVLLEAELHQLKSSKDMDWPNQVKPGVEENFSHFQDAKTKANRRPLEERNTETNDHFQKQICDLSRRLSEKDAELQDSKMKVFYLEEELQRKVSALSSAERRLKDHKESLSHDSSSQVSYFTRSLSRVNSRIGANKPTIPPSREAKELSDLRSKVKLLEAEVKKKAAELEESKEQMKGHCIQLSSRLEQLELANEELVMEHSNSKLERAMKELSSVQTQNAMLCQRESELLSRLTLQEALQSEVDTLKQEKKELENALSKPNAAANGDNILKRISTLENELAEVLESNLMYKTQLHSVFAKQQNVHAAALENLGSVDKVVKDITELKRKNMTLENELCDMKERYFSMSLQFAEVEAEREELVITIRNLRGTKKFVPLRSAIF